MVDRAAVALVLTILCAGLAGCAEKRGDAPQDEADAAVDQLDLAPTATTGIIRGVVVDAAIRPLAGAAISITGDAPRETTSNEDGAFGFANLQPGTYFLQVSKPGYFPIQQSADVVAGEAEPPIVKVVLQADAASAPFVQAITYEGYIECTTSFVVLCGIANVLTGDNYTNDRFAWDQYFADGAMHLQAEMVWESTQALSPNLYFEMEALNDGCEKSEDDRYEEVGAFLNNTEGPSPIYATVNQTQVEAWTIGQECPIWMSLFSSGAPGVPCLRDVPDPANALPGWCLVGFTISQRFTMYFHTFHGYLPPPGWRFAIDGNPPPPPQ